MCTPAFEMLFTVTLENGREWGREGTAVGGGEWAQGETVGLAG